MRKAIKGLTNVNQQRIFYYQVFDHFSNNNSKHLERVIKIVIQLIKYQSFIELRDNRKKVDRSIIRFICFTTVFEYERDTSKLYVNGN